MPSLAPAPSVTTRLGEVLKACASAARDFWTGYWAGPTGG